MKFLSIVLSLILLLTVAPEINAQTVPSPCVPDCVTDSYGPTKTAVFLLTSGCYVRVWYSTRLACGTYRDLAIQKIEFLTPGCGSTSLASVLDEVTAALFVHNPMGFPTPNTDSCITTYRAVMASCWKADTVECDGDTIAVPCDSVDCCLSAYDVCADSVDVITVTKKWSTSPSDTCDPADSSCQSICDLGTSEIVSSVDEMDNRTASVLQTFPNPAMSSLTIRSEEIPPGKYFLKVVSSDGETVFSNSISVGASARLDTVIDVQEFASGSYYVTLSAGSISFVSHFTVSR